jgi:hypothetical protein
MGSQRRSNRFTLLEGGVWLPGALCDANSPLSRSNVTQAYARYAGQVQRALDQDALLRRLFEADFPLNLRPPGLFPTLSFLPLVRRSGDVVQALRTAQGWALEHRGEKLGEAIREARWRMALMSETVMHRWQANVPISEDDFEAEALSILLARRKTLRLPGENHLLQVSDRGPFLLTGSRAGVRVLSTIREVEALRLARAAVLEAWTPLPERRIEAIYRSVLPGNVSVKQTEPDQWRIEVDGAEVTLVDAGESWAVGLRRIRKRAREARPERLTCLWAARVGTAQRTRRFWRPTDLDASLALARSHGVGLWEGVVAYHLIQQERTCLRCRASFVVGGACLNPVCATRQGDDDHRGAPLVQIRGGLFVYAPDRPGWVGKKNGRVQGVAGDGLIRVLPPQRILVKQATGRTALLIARLMSHTDRPLPVEARLPLPAPPDEAVAETRRAVESQAPFPSRFAETLKALI